MFKRHLPSPAIVISVIALFVALSGTAVAAGVVPLAKRALTADKAKQAKVADVAKRLGDGATASLIDRASQSPGPASTAAGLITVKTAQWSLAPGAFADSTATCDSGQKAIAGGFDDPAGYAHSWDSRPTGDGAGWRTFVSLSSDAPAQMGGTVYAICLK